ncbi:type VII secretion protein EccCb [Nocardioides ultimimeridianus]
MTTSTTDPDLAAGRLELDAPPRLPDREAGGGAAMTVLPMLGSVGSIALFAGVGGHSVLRYVAGGMFLLTTAIVVLLQLDRQRVSRARRTDAGRTDYLRHLAGARGRLREAAERQRVVLLGLHPPPDALAARVGAGAVEQRGPDHPWFLRVRWGAGEQPAALEPVAADEHPEADPAAVVLARRLVAAHRTQPGLPLVVDLRAHPRIDLDGCAEEARALARALVCSAAATHAPENLAVAVLATPPALGGWEWLKWLPHAASPDHTDEVGPARLAHSDPEVLDALLPPSGGPHLLLVVDGDLDPPARDGVTVIALRSRGATTGLRLPGRESAAEADRCSLPSAEALARRLTRPLSTAGPSAAAPDLDSLLAQLRDPDRLCVPLGADDDGPVLLDLEESARGGMGPHGLVIGATGSGKSELLRTLVLGLATTHPPDRLNLVLVDFKGGATFAGLADLPHVSAVITNLDEDLALVERMQDALSGELVRRQRLLRDAGLGSRHDHEQARRAGATLEPLPSLLVVIDEFSELLAAEPELIDLFVSIGRLGRSLGIHLLLASQRLDEGRLRGLDAHLSYRIGLRTFSAQESRAVLGVPDAYELPAVPGLGYLRSDPTTLRRFTAAYVSGPSRSAEGGQRPPLLPFTLAEVRATTTPRTVGGETQLDVAVRRLARHPCRAHQVWLPPLDASAPLAGAGGLVDDLRPDSRLGLTSPYWRAAGPLVVPVGVVDRPREQRRDVLRLELAGAGGHVAVVGGPRSGKSTLLRTVVSALALTTTPAEAQVYLLDLGGALAPLAGLPHVAGSAGRAQPDVVRRILAELTTLLDRREQHFRDHGIDSIESYRSRRAAGSVDDGHGDVFLVVDGWGTLRTDFDDLEPALAQLQARGLAFGFHVVASGLRWSDFRAATRDLFGSRLELRLGDPMDSEIGRHAAARVPPRPGRGLTADGLHFLAALPRIEAGGVDALVAAVAAAWAGPTGPKLRLLPARITLDEISDPEVRGRGLVLGIDEGALEPVVLDVDHEPHLLALGDRGSGRSALLRAVCREVVRSRGPDEARILIVDPRRSLLGEVPAEQLVGHVTSGPAAERAIAELAAYLTQRLPGPDVDAARLRARSWWTGAEVFVVVDDHDLVADGSSSPLAALQPLLAQASDVGLHLVLARRAGGASRALYEPILRTLLDLGQPGLLLSGDPGEGPLLGGVRPVPAPPGRARLITRDRAPTVVQLGWTDPSS